MHKSPQATVGFCVCGGKFIYMQFARECAYRADMESAPTATVWLYVGGGVPDAPVAPLKGSHFLLP